MVIVLVSAVFPKRLPYDTSGVPVNDDEISLHWVTGAGRRHDDIADSDRTVFIAYFRWDHSDDAKRNMRREVRIVRKLREEDAGFRCIHSRN